MAQGFLWGNAFLQVQKEEVHRLLTFLRKKENGGIRMDSGMLMIRQVQHQHQRQPAHQDQPVHQNLQEIRTVHQHQPLSLVRILEMKPFTL